MKPFQDYMRAPAACRFKRNIQPPRLHFLYRDAEQARHFAGMRRQHHCGGVAFVQSIGHAVKRVQPVGIQNDWEFGLLQRPGG